jgi:mannose-6-phosphate isomerase-like protein (cupin superfamily)
MEPGHSIRRKNKFNVRFKQPGSTTMKKIALLLIAAMSLTTAWAQTPAPAIPPVATDVTAEEIAKFIDSLPKDRVSDRPIKNVEVTGDYRVGVYGVFRPKEFPGGSNLHQVNTTEIYYMLSGYATLVTGGTMTEARQENANWVRGTAIENGVVRRVVPGDVIIIPGHTPHWFSELETDITYLIIRPDPDNRIPLTNE